MKIKIIKRSFASPILSMNIWLIPTLAYLLQKSLGVINEHKEWIWLIALPLTFLLWLFINFKIDKRETKKINLDVTKEYLFDEMYKGNITADEVLLTLFAKDLEEKSRNLNLKKSLK